MTRIFQNGEIWAFPTDTSFGLGVRCDDVLGLESLRALKRRDAKKYFSLMVSDVEMLEKFAEIPPDFDAKKFFFQSPRTAILRPKSALPHFPQKFWPESKVAFRVCTIPEVARAIAAAGVPVSATSANFSGENPIFECAEIALKFGKKVKIFPKFQSLPRRPMSEIWDFCQKNVVRIR